MRRHRFSFSLLEILVSLSLIALLSSLVGIKGYELLAHHRFQTSTKLFAQELQHFRMISMAYDCDIACDIRKEGSSYKVFWTPDFIPEKLKTHPLVFELEETKQLRLDNKPISSFHLVLYSNGRLSEHGILSFLPKKEEEALALDLIYPSSVKKLPLKNRAALTPPLYPEKELA